VVGRLEVRRDRRPPLTELPRYLVEIAIVPQLHPYFLSESMQRPLTSQIDDVDAEIFSVVQHHTRTKWDSGRRRRGLERWPSSRDEEDPNRDDCGYGSGHD
jgi:hypothetical protein